MSKRICSAIIAFVMIFTMVTPFALVSAASEEISTEYTDLLVELGVVDEGADLAKQITRIEFLKIALSLSAEVDTAKKYYTKTVFKDVASNYPDASVISYAYDRGYVVGYNGNFEPDEIISAEEANTLLLRVTGYSHLIKLKGLPHVERITNINEGIDKSAAKITFAVAHRMIYNILEAPCYANIIAIGEDVEFGVNEDITVMGHFLGIYTDKAILTAANKIHMKDASYNSTEAIIEGIKYDCEAVGAEKYVGYNVKYYYTKNNSEYQLKAVRPSSNDVIELDATSLSITDSKYSLTNIVYDDANDRSRTIVVDKYADVIYNGEAFPDYTLDTLKPLEGKLVFVDNNTDGKFDVIVMDIYENFFIKSADSVERKITATDGRTASLKKSDSRSVDIFGADGSYYEFADINEGTVVTLYQSKSGSKSTVYVSSDVLLDNIEKISNKDIITVGGKEYKIDANFKASAAYASNPITIETKTGLYLDCFGKIAGIGERSAKFNNYGYLLKGRSESEFDTTYSLRIFNAQGRFEIYQLKENLKFNGVPSTAAYVYGQLAATGFSALIKFDSTTDNRITSVELAEDKTDTTAVEIIKDRFTLDVKLEESASQNGSRYRSGILGSKYLVQSGTTIVFNIPTDLSKEYDFSVGDNFTVNNAYTCDIYDLNEVYTCGVIVRRISSGGNKITEGERTEKQIFLVDQVYEELVEDSTSETRQVIAGWLGSVYREYTIKRKENDSEQLVSNLKAGDVVKIYASNSSSEVTNMELVISLSDNNTYSEKSYNTSDSEPGSVARMQYGRVGQVKNGCFTMSCDGGTTVYPGYASSANIYIYYKNGKTNTEKADVGALTAETTLGAFNGDEVFVNKRWDQVVDIIIVKN